MSFSMPMASQVSSKHGLKGLSEQVPRDFSLEGSAKGAPTAPQLIASRSSSNRAPAPDLDDVRLEPRDGYGVPVIPFTEEQVVHYQSASAMIAEDIEGKLAENPDLRIVVVGEPHTPTAQSVFDFLAYYLFTGDSGGDFVLAFEAFTSPHVNDLIDQLYDGVIGPDEFLARASVDLQLRYLNALARHEEATGESVEEPATIDTWRATLERDVIRYFNDGRRVALLDVNRYDFEDDTGRRANRTAGMEESLRRLAEEHPDSVILAQVGKLHVVPEFVGNPDIVENGPVNFGVPVGRIPAERPLMSALSEELGPENVLFYIGSEYREWAERHGVEDQYLGKPTLPNMDPLPGGEIDVEATRQRMIESGNCPPGEDACWRFSDPPNATYFIFHHPYYDPSGREGHVIPNLDGDE